MDAHVWHFRQELSATNTTIHPSKVEECNKGASATISIKTIRYELWQPETLVGSTMSISEIRQPVAESRGFLMPRKRTVVDDSFQDHPNRRCHRNRSMFSHVCWVQPLLVERDHICWAPGMQAPVQMPSDVMDRQLNWWHLAWQLFMVVCNVISVSNLTRVRWEINRRCPAEVMVSLICCIGWSARIV